MSDKMKTAPNRLRKQSPGPNHPNQANDWRATVNGTQKCSVAECDRADFSRGMCKPHYMKWRRLNGVMFTPERLEAKFRSRFIVSGPDDCWEWTGFRTKKGYGALGMGAGKVILASRLALSLASGIPISTEKLACHTCDNPPCVNPAHLYWGTHVENMRDVRDRDRKPYGVDHHKAVLTNAIVTELRVRVAGGENARVVAADLEINYATARNALCGRTWRRADGPIHIPISQEARVLRAAADDYPGSGSHPSVIWLRARADALETQDRRNG
jgi:hypothetical protein